MTAIHQNRRRTLQLGTALATCIACAGFHSVAVAQPVQPGVGSVISGGAEIGTHTDATTSFNVDLRNTNSVIAWDRFSIGAGQSVGFVSTDGAGTANQTTPFAVLNRVTGGTFSDIQGGIVSQNNIQVWLANPNGIVFGNGASFNGGSLVLTTLNTGIDAAFAASNANNATQLSGASTAAITIDAGASIKATGTTGTVLMLAQDLSNSGTIDGTGDVGLFVASDVTFAAGTRSPLSYTINAGTAASFAAPRLRVLGSGSVSGQNVSLVAVTQADAISNLLQTATATNISAKSVDGNVYLTTGIGGGAAASTGDQLTAAGTLKGGTSTGEVRLTAAGNIAAGGTITAGSNVVVNSSAGNAAVTAAVAAGADYGVFARDIALGNGATAVTQSGARNVSIQSTGNGAITGAAGLTLRVNTGATAGLSRLIIDAGSTGTIDFARTSNIVARGTASGSATVPVGLRYDNDKALSLGNVTASSIGEFNGLFIGTQLTGTSDFTAGSITSDATFDADFDGKIDLVGVTTSSPLGDVLLTAGTDLNTTGLLKAVRNVTLDAGGDATVAGGVDAGSNYTVSGANVALGSGATVVTQKAAGQVTVTTSAAGGKISGDAGLTLRSNSGNASALNRLVLDAGTDGSIAFALASSIAAGDANNAGAAAIGVRFDRTTASGTALALGNVTGLRLADFGGLTIGSQLTGAGDFTANAIETNNAFDASFTGKIAAASITTHDNNADVTLSAGGSIGSSQSTNPALSIYSARDVSLTAGTDVTLATIRGRNLDVDAGSSDFAPAARQDGSISLADADMTGNANLVAWGGATKGEIRVGKAVADGTLTLDNTLAGGASGSIKVLDSLEAGGLLTLRSTQDILVAGYAGTGTAGTVTSTGGAIDARADGSVLAFDVAADTARPAFIITQAGVGGYSAAGNLSVNTAGAADVAVDSLTAGGVLSVNVTGNLYGRTQSTTNVPGAFFKASGNVAVAGDAAAGRINLNRVESTGGGSVTLSAAQVAVGTLVTQGATNITAATSYIGLRRFPDAAGNVTVTLGAPATPIPLVTTGNFYAQATDLNAGTTMNVDVSGAAQVGTAQAGGALALAAGGLVAGTVTSTAGSAAVTANQGTLTLGTASAGRDLTVTKRLGSTATAGDEVRFGTLAGGTAGTDGFAGDVTVSSQTHVRGNQIVAAGGNVLLRAGYDSAANVISQPGEVTGLGGGKMQITATALTDASSSGSMSISSGALANFSTLQAATDISIVAGTNSAPQNGAVRVDTALANGSIYIVNRNGSPGSSSGIAFGTLDAGGDIRLLTSTGNGGDAFGTLARAGSSVGISVNDIQIDTIQAGTDVALKANLGRIADAAGTGGMVVTAGRNIAADADQTIQLGLADARNGDLGLRAGGNLIATTLQATDDVTVTAASVHLGTVTSTGAADNGTDVAFGGASTISNPYLPGFSAPVPTVSGAATSPGGNISITAVSGDVTGLPVSAGSTPAVSLYTVGDALSSDYGRANLTARDPAGNITVNAANGGAQLGSVVQGSLGTGAGDGGIDVTALAVSADSVTSLGGDATLTATQGTLVVGTVAAFDTASLIKSGTTADAGNEVRFNTVTGGQNGVSSARLVTDADGNPLGVRIQSSTNVLGDSAKAEFGGVRVDAIEGSVTGRNAPAGMTIDASNTAALHKALVRSAAAIDLADVTASGAISIIAGATGVQAGSIDVGNAKSLQDSIYLTAINGGVLATNGIAYNTLSASGEIIAVTSGSNRGDVLNIATSIPFDIDAGSRVAIDARNMALGTVRARSDSIALRAQGFIDADVLQAATSVAGLAGGSITIGSASGIAGDVALQAAGVLTIGSVTGSDDVQLTGTSVRVGAANTLGGVDVNDPDFAALTAVRDPSPAGIAGLVPSPSGATPDSDASRITIVATSGDVTGLAVNPLVTPLLGTVTTGAQLSTDYGKANLTALDGGISVTANNGSVQLGNALLDYSYDGTSFPVPQTLAITARAISADTLLAQTGSVDASATLGTLVVGEARAQAGYLRLIKQAGDATVDGDELRVLTRAGAAFGSVEVVSGTHVRAPELGSGASDITVTALNGDITGVKTGAAALLPVPTVAQGSDLTSSYGLLTITGIGNNSTIAVNASGSVQLGNVVQNNIFPYSFPVGNGTIQIAGEGVSARSLNANSGAIDVVARSGTLVLGTAVARGAINLSKAGGTLAQAGNEVRFALLTAGGSSTATSRDIQIVSQTNIRGTSASTDSGSVTLRAGRNGTTTNLAGEITGIGFTSATPSAMNVTAGGSGSTLRATAGGRVQFGTLVAGDDISIVSGDTAAPLNGAIRIGTAQAGGDIFLTNKNVAPGTDAGIGFTSLRAGGDAVLITSAGNGGDAVGSLIDAANVSVSVNDILVGTITARGDVALQANGDGLVDLDLVSAGGGIGVDAGTSIRVGTAQAGLTDVAMRAGTSIVVGSVTAADDVSLTGTAVTADKIEAQGTGNDGTDVVFGAGSLAANPYDAGFSAPIPTINGARSPASTGGLIAVNATAGSIAVTTSATAQGSALFRASDDVAINSGTATTGSLAIQAGHDVSSATALSAGEDLAIQANGRVGLLAASAGDDLIVSALGPITIDSITMTGLGTGNSDVVFSPSLGVGAATLPANNLQLTSNAGDITLGALTVQAPAADAVLALTATNGAIAVTRDLAVQGGLTIRAAGDVTLGDDQARTQTATGLIDIASSGGSIRQGTGRLALGANSDGVGTEALTLNAKTDVALGATDLAGGSARQSAVGITAQTGSIAVGTASGASFTATAGIGFTANGAIVAGTSARGADAASPTIAIIANQGDIVATTIEATDPGHDVNLRASSAVTLDRLTAARSVNVVAGSSLTANAVTATSGSLSLGATSLITVGSTTSGSDSTLLSGAGTNVGKLVAGGAANVDAGGPVGIVELQSGGAASINSRAAIGIGTLTSGGATSIVAGDALTIDKLTSGATTGLSAGTDATLGTLVSTGDTTIATGGAVLQLTSLDTQGALDVRAGSSANLGTLAVRNAAQINTARGSVSLAQLTSGGAASVNAATSGTIGTLASGGNATVATGGALKLDKLTAGGTTTLNAGTDATLGALTSTGNTTIATGGAVLQLTSLDTQGALDLRAGSSANLGTLAVRNAAQINTARGSVSLTQLTSGGAASVNGATSGTIGTLASGGNATVTTGGALKLDKLTAGGTTTLNAGTDATLGALTSTGNTTIATGGAVLQLTSLDTQGALDLRAGSSATLGTLAVRNAAQINTARGSVSLTQLTSGGAASVNGATSGTIGTLASGGNATVTTGGALKLDKLTAGGTTTLNAGTDATLGTLTSTGNTTIATGGAVLQLTSLDTQGALAVTAGTNANLGSVKAKGAVQATARSGSVTIGDLGSGSDATITAASQIGFGTISTGSAATLTAGNGSITGASLSSGAATRLTAATAVKLDRLASGANTTIQAGTDATLGPVTSAGDATVTAKGVIALNGAFTATGKTVVLTAKDAAFGADVNAATIKVVDDAGAGNKLLLGDGVAGTGFALSDAEVGRLKASSTLVLDAASAATRQDVAIGKLTLAGAPKVLILANGTRIDVTGRIAVSGTTTNFQLGGSGEEAGLASVLRVAAQADGSGGSIAAPSANVSLRAANIAFGQDAGFLSAIGVTETGTGDSTAALTFNDRASSALYFAGINGGKIYTVVPPVQLLTANNLTLTYTNFAVVQNTGLQGQTTGTTIGNFVTVNASGTRPVLGLFGTISGRQGTAAALLGNLAFKINLNDISSTRVNGCIVGEGAGCLSTLVFAPNLAAIDAVRPTLFTVASDYEVPFNPLIGTNNDALFGDVGTFGLADVPLDPIECADPSNPQCPAQQKGAQ